MRARRRVFLVALFVLVTWAVSSQITLFVIQPIGAIPQGITAVIWRGQNMEFVDSADAICAREMQGVSLFCRAAVLGAIGGDESRIILRLPYSQWLYEVSTGGKVYEQ